MRNPILTEYSRSPWMMEKGALANWFGSLAETSVGEALLAVKVEYPLPLRVEGDKAVIPISGVLLKSVPGWVRLYGMTVTGYDEIEAMVSAALADDSVQQIELRITSPGGQVAGGMEAAAAIRAADAIKPVTAVVEDLCASGAFWLANSARRIEANANAEVGSIGVFTYYLDWTGLEDRIGIKTVVIRSGPHKGMGLDAITEEQIGAVQEVIDGMNAHFIEQVAHGRRVSRDRAAEWATGRVWLAPAALKLGLIDAVTGPVQLIHNPSEQAVHKGESTMSNENEQTPQAQAPEAPVVPVAAEQTVSVDPLAGERQRVADVKAAFTSDPKFALEAIEQGWSVTEAKAARHDRLEAKAALTSEGDDGLPYHDSDQGSGGPDFMTEAKALHREKGISMTEAMRQVQEDDPGCYQRFLASEQERPVRQSSGKHSAGRVSA